MRSKDRRLLITSDFTEGHEYEIRVSAVDSTGLIQQVEDSPTASIVIRGKLANPATPTGAVVASFLSNIYLSWTNPLDPDFLDMEIWGTTVNELGMAFLIARMSGTSFTHNINAANRTWYYWLRARSTSGKYSDYSPNTTTTTLTATTSAVVATDIDDFAITASKTFINTIILTGDSWSNNSPGAGEVTWNQHNLTYGGAYYRVAAGYTANRYITWTVGNTGGSGTVASPYLTTYSGDAAYTSADDKFNVAVNEGGTHQLVWNSSANMVIGSAYILDLAVVNAKINDCNVNKLTAGTISSKVITLGITGGGGDCYIGAGKTDFTNAQTGFILGLDDSDSDKPKFYIGSPTKYLNWDGSALTIRGTLNADDIVAGTLTGRVVRTAASGARSEMNPGIGYGFIAYDDAANTVFRVQVGGPEVGDVWIGNVGVGTNSVHWDKSAGTLAIRGLLTADDIVSGGTITGNTLQTAVADQRVVISQATNTVKFYKTGVVDPVLIIDDSISGSIPGIKMSSSAGGVLIIKDTDTNNNVTIFPEFISVSSDIGGGFMGYFHRRASNGDVVKIVHNISYTGTFLKCERSGGNVRLQIDTTGNVDTEGYVDADAGFKDNGTAGVDGTFADHNGNTITVSGGIITDLTT